MFQGTGENGKGALGTDGLIPALGDYASAASPKLFQSNRSEHSTERADLRGQRLLIAEELTEGRAIDVTALKQIQDVGQIKARHVHRDNFTFTTSHSLFTTTNYMPVVSETDHGTWRRLALLRFPYTFRKPGEPLDGVTDRRGDPTLKARISAGAGGRHDAIVTWAVEGAMRWYADPDTALAKTPTVEADTRAWRVEADRILGFWDERLIPDRKACALTSELHEEFNEWLDGNGHNGWAKELFGPRFKGHSETVRHRVDETRTTTPDGLVRRLSLTLGSIPARVYVCRGVRFRTAADDVPPAETGPDGAGAGNGPDLQECDPLPDLPDPNANLPRTPHVREFAKGSGRSGSDPLSAPVFGVSEAGSGPGFNADGTNIGPCVTDGCGTPIVRYGPDGRSFCDPCMAKVAP